MMDTKAENARKIEELTEDEKDEVIKLVNKMTVIFDFVQKNMHNTQWMDTRSGRYEGLASGLTFIHTVSLVRFTIALVALTKWLKYLTIGLILLTIISLIFTLGTFFHWF